MQPLTETLGHAELFAAAARLLQRIDVVGVTEELGAWSEVLCARAGLSPCPEVLRLNEGRRSRGGGPSASART